MALDYKAIGKRVCDSRKKLGITQEKLSEMVDLSPAHISHIESGKTKVSLESLVNIANALNTTTDSLLYDNLTISTSSYDKELRDMLEHCSVREKQTVYAAVENLINAMKG